MKYLPRAFKPVVSLLAINLWIAAFAAAQTPNSTQNAAGAAKALDDYAVQKVQPAYPPLAKAAKVTGVVLVLVTVDEQGNVVAAEAVSGHPLLKDAAVTAARGWKFKPAGARVVGTITFNFEMDKPGKPDAPKGDATRDQTAAWVEKQRDEVKAKPDSPEAHYQLGLALYTQRKLDEAIASFKQALQLRPDYPEAYQRLVQLYMNARRFNEVVDVTRQRISVKADDAAAYHQLGLAYYDLHKFDEAIEAFKHSLQLKPGVDLSYQVYREMGLAHVYLREFDEATECFNKSLDLKPDDPYTLRQLAWAYQYQGRYDEAIDAYQKVLKSLPNDYSSIVNIGWNYAAMGRLAEAERQYREAIRIGARSAQGYLGLAAILSREQKLDEAESTLRQAVTVAPTSVAGHIALGNMLFNRGKGQEGLAEAREALRLEPNNPTALNNVGYYLVELNQNLEEALKLIQRAVDSAPNIPGHRDSLGWAYFKLGRLEEAERYLAGAANETTSPVVHEHLGDVYDKRGKKETALAEWQKALAELQKGSGQLADSAQLARLKSKISGAGH